MSRKKVTLIFMDGWIFYSPFTLNLYQELCQKFEVQLLTVRPDARPPGPLPPAPSGVTYLNDLTKPLRIIARLHRLLHGILDWLRCGGLKIKCDLIGWYFARLIRREVRRFAADEVVAIDFISLHHARQLGHSIHFVLLEINECAAFWRWGRMEQIKSVLANSLTRIEHVFPDWHGPRFTAVNSRVFHRRPAQEKNGRFIYSGSMLWWLGLGEILDFCRLTGEPCDLSGPLEPRIREEMRKRYGDLLQSGQVRLLEAYIPHERMEEFLEPYLMGFAFYDINYYPTRRFNQMTGSPGKIYAYLSAGVPVICSDLPGMRVIRDYQCGAMLPEVTPDSIQDAQQKIRANYPAFQHNCLRAAEEFSFDRQIAPFMEHLAGSLPGRGD